MGPQNVMTLAVNNIDLQDNSNIHGGHNLSQPITNPSVTNTLNSLQIRRRQTPRRMTCVLTNVEFFSSLQDFTNSYMFVKGDNPFYLMRTLAEDSHKFCFIDPWVVVGHHALTLTTLDVVEISSLTISSSFLESSPSQSSLFSFSEVTSSSLGSVLFDFF